MHLLASFQYARSLPTYFPPLEGAVISMVDVMRLTPERGGNRHPLSVRTFILDRLAAMGEDYISSMHRAYKAELLGLASKNGRGRPYHASTYHSFEMAVQGLAREGLIEFSGREEESQAPQFVGWSQKPVRRYYRLRTTA